MPEDAGHQPNHPQGSIHLRLGASWAWWHTSPAGRGRGCERLPLPAPKPRPQSATLFANAGWVVQEGRSPGCQQIKRKQQSRLQKLGEIWFPANVDHDRITLPLRVPSPSQFHLPAQTASALILVSAQTALTIVASTADRAATSRKLRLVLLLSPKLATRGWIVYS